ncbi:MAG: hypothetical protein OXI96_10170 [Acidimicrobiaceae bacterium]|nr:hypothetical protein [Acidimicrobiaceae bacterium]
MSIPLLMSDRPSTDSSPPDVNITAFYALGYVICALDSSYQVVTASVRL